MYRIVILILTACTYRILLSLLLSNVNILRNISVNQLKIIKQKHLCGKFRESVFAYYTGKI